MKISVIGLGYVGTVTAVCLARDGHDVTGIDVDPVKLNLLKKGQAPIIEAKIGELTQEAISSRRLRVTNTIDGSIASDDLIFICVGTPSAANGSQDLSAVRRVSEQLGAALKHADGFPVVVMRSTIYPGSTEAVVQPILEEFSNSKVGVEFGLCFQPEFLREGSSVDDFYNPPFTIAGSDSQESIDRLKSLFASLPGEFIETSFKAAEMLKLTCNAFHALKISFANEVGRLCQSLGVESREVMELMCRDTSLNISPAYLRPGFAYGGSCLPKDLRAMLYLARTKDLELPVLNGVAQTNSIHIEHAAKMIMDSGSRKVGLIGLSFKPDTDDLRESPLVALAERLIGKGYELRIYDPAVNMSRLIGANKRFIEESIPHVESLLSDDLGDVCSHGDVLVIGQKYDELSDLLMVVGGAKTKIVDLVGIDGQIKRQVNYVGVCW